MRLVHSQGLDRPYATFEGNKDLKYYDFDKVRLQIDVLTDEIAGLNKGIIDKPILLTIYSPDCPDMTMIDLPGITRIPIGEQAKKY